MIALDADHQDPDSALAGLLLVLLHAASPRAAVSKTLPISCS